MKMFKIAAATLTVLAVVSMSQVVTACDLYQVRYQRVVTPPATTYATVVYTPTIQAPRIAYKPIVRKPIVQVNVGATVQLPGHFGQDAGTICLHVSGVGLDAEIHDWKQGLVMATLPPVRISQPTRATVEIYRASGTLAKRIHVQLVPPAEIVETSPAGGTLLTSN